LQVQELLDTVAEFGCFFEVRNCPIFNADFFFFAEEGLEGDFKGDTVGLVRGWGWEAERRLGVWMQRGEDFPLFGNNFLKGDEKTLNGGGVGPEGWPGDG